MKQEINLYQPILRRQKKVFSAMAMVQISVFFLIIFTGIYIYGEMKIRPIQSQLVDLETNVAILSGELERLKRRMPGGSSGSIIENEIASLTNELKKSREIQEVLENQVHGNTSGMSDYLEAFARQIVEGAWLTGFSISDGGRHLSLEGNTMVSELVPVYISGLSEETVLEGIAFNVMELSRPDEPSNYFNFLVSTR